MTILNDSAIQHGEFFEPNEPKSHSHGMSYGLSSFGYDVRMGNSIKILSQKLKRGYRVLDTADPRIEDQYSEYILQEDDKACFLLRPFRHCLVVSYETVRIPADCLAVTYPKSTLSRLGLEVTPAVLEPNWKGRITFSLFNRTDRCIRLYYKMPLAQVVFFWGELPNRGYEGKYQGTMDVTSPILTK